MKRSAYVLLIIVVSLFLIALFTVEKKQQSFRNLTQPPQQMLSDDIRGLTFTDLEGNIVPFAQYIDTPIVLHSWSTWCIFCTREIPDLAEVQTKFADRVHFVAINRGEGEDHITRFIQAHDPNKRLHYLLDDGDLFYTLIGGFAMPETLFIKANGEIVLHKRGPLTQDEIRAATAALIE